MRDPRFRAPDVNQATELAALAERLQAHVRKLAGEIGERNVFRSQALQAAADYLRAQWASLGYQVTSQSYEAHGVRSENLEVTLPGVSRPSEIILIGAHYDSVKGSPGANDNASGVAALLELSGALAQAKPARTLRFVAFVNEEPPFFYWGEMGSKVYAEGVRARGDDIRLMISLEMLGYYSEEPGSQRYPPLFGFFYPDRANFIGFVSNFGSRRQLKELVAAFRACSDFPAESLATFEFVPGVGWSDHRSFWREGYPAVMVTDTAFYRYSHYHSQADTPEKLNYPAMAQVGAAGSAWRLSAAVDRRRTCRVPHEVRERQRCPIPALPFCHIGLKATKTRPYDPSTLGEHIKRARIERGLTQSNAVAFLSVSVEALHNWETGKTTPSVKYWPAIMEFLGYCPYQQARSLGDRLRLHRMHRGLAFEVLAEMLDTVLQPLPQ